MTQTEQLIASLTALPCSDYQPSDGQYIDWSSRDDDGVVSLELGNGDESAQVDMTRDDMLALQQRLTAWLLANPA